MGLRRRYLITLVKRRNGANIQRTIITMVVATGHCQRKRRQIRYMKNTKMLMINTLCLKRNLGRLANTTGRPRPNIQVSSGCTSPGAAATLPTRVTAITFLASQNNTWCFAFSLWRLLILLFYVKRCVKVESVLGSKATTAPRRSCVQVNKY